jgi:hypothetical protein
MPSIFDIVILIGRPASGKSEIIDYLRHTPLEERRARFHIGALDILDDFPMLWAWFEEDHLLTEKLGQPGLHTDAGGYFKFEYLWHLLIERFNLEYRKRLRDDPAYHARATLIVEFARGVEHGGYAQAFSHLADDILRQAAIVYVNVPFEESLRKNRRRANPNRPDNILEHSLSDDKLIRLYRDDDWAAFTAGDSRTVTVRLVRVPYVVFENADDVTTHRGPLVPGKPDLLGQRLEDVLGRLWRLRQAG